MNLCQTPPSLKYVSGAPGFQPLLQSAEYGRTRRDLVHAEPILAMCTVCNTTCYTRIRVYAHKEAKY